MTAKSKVTRKRISSWLVVGMLVGSLAMTLHGSRLCAQNDLEKLFDDDDLEEIPQNNPNAPPMNNMIPGAPAPMVNNPGFPDPSAPTNGGVPGGSSGGFGNPGLGASSKRAGKLPTKVQASGSNLAPSPGTKVGKNGASPIKDDGLAKPKAPLLKDAAIEDITDENYPDEIESFDYPNAEITDVIKAISELTGKNFIIDPSVRGKISILAPSKVTVAEAYKAFLSALAINGFTIVPSGKFLKIKSTRLAQRDSIETYSGSYYPNGDLMITRIVHLKYISADEVNKNLRGILQSKDGEIMPYPPTNSLIITDLGASIERIMSILNQIDRPGFEEKLEVIPIRYAKAKDLADLIDQIINKDPSRHGGQPGGFNGGVPRFRGGGAGGAGGSSGSEQLSLVAPDDRTNAIIVVGNQDGINKIRELVKKLDYKLDPNKFGGVFVYYVRYGEAEKIATTLSGLAQASSAASGGGAPGGIPGGGGKPVTPGAATVFGGDVKITADKTNNSLIITASKQDYDIVQSLLAKIDIPRDQVFVEAIIMEMNATRTRIWDPNYVQFQSVTDASGNKVASPARAGFVGGNLANLLNPTGKSAIIGFGSGDNLNLTIGGQTTIVPSLLALINILVDQTDANVLSTPQVLALDNEDASIEVGQKVAIGQSSSTTGSTVTQQPQFENATISLKITPHISPDSETVRMKIEQDVKELKVIQVQAKLLADSTNAIAQRSIKTNIVVNSGDTAVLGGLVKDSENVTESKIPVLGDLPILGWLFKSSTVSKEKTNLIVFLTPKILRNQSDGHQLLNKKAGDRVEWLKKNFEGRDPYGKVIENLPRAEVTPDKNEHRRE